MKTGTKIAFAPIAVALLLSMCGFGWSVTGLSAQEAGTNPSILRLLPVEAPPLQVGSEIEGSLTGADYVMPDGGAVRGFALEGQSGQRVTLDLISDDFDAILYLIGPGLEETLSDDDSGGACHARLSVFLPADGPYLVVAGSWGVTGAFTLRVSDRPGAPEPGYCGEGLEPDVS